MIWKQPHISKIYEALGAIGDGRIEIATEDRRFCRHRALPSYQSDASIRSASAKLPSRHSNPYRHSVPRRWSRMVTEACLRPWAVNVITSVALPTSGWVAPTSSVSSVSPAPSAVSAFRPASFSSRRSASWAAAWAIWLIVESRP